MTDGIIQQVFRKYRLAFKRDKDGIDFLAQLHQELIEKISQEIEFGDSQGDYVMLSKLIGDNKE